MKAPMKPCPFCGGEGRVIPDPGNKHRSNILYRPQCGQCGGGLGGFDQSDFAVAAWNRRTDNALGLDEPITEDWLKESGFRWSQHNRQNTRHWLLWLGDAVREREGFNLTSYEDIGIELAAGYNDPKWFCWFRSDSGGLYGRFLHVRHVRLRLDVVRLAEAITGYPWTPEYHIGGCARGPLGYKNMLDYARRKDVELLVEPNRAWHDIERDPYRAGASAPTLKELVDREAGKIP